MDVDHGEGECDDIDIQDEKLYCVCKTRYDEDKVMIACDRFVPCQMISPTDIVKLTLIYVDATVGTIRNV